MLLVATEERVEEVAGVSVPGDVGGYGGDVVTAVSGARDWTDEGSAETGRSLVIGNGSDATALRVDAASPSGGLIRAKNLLSPAPRSGGKQSATTKNTIAQAKTVRS